MSGEGIWSESVYLDAVSLDGSVGFVARLCRYPSVRVAWVWAHVFTPQGCVAFNDSRYPCGEVPVAVEEPDATYEAGGGTVVFHRDGARAAIARGTLTARVQAHEGTTAPEGPGPLGLTIDASFAPWRVMQGKGNLPGRTEEHGTVTVRATWPGGSLELEAPGQWHEQHQDAPRFTVPFTYATVRGERTSLVALRGATRSGGILRKGERGEQTSSFDIDPPGEVRNLSVARTDGTIVRGSLAATYRYSIPIDGGARPGSLVTGTLDGEPVSGCVNDWEPPA